MTPIDDAITAQTLSMSLEGMPAELAGVLDHTFVPQPGSLNSTLTFTAQGDLPDVEPFDVRVVASWMYDEDQGRFATSEATLQLRTRSEPPVADFSLSLELGGADHLVLPQRARRDVAVAISRFGSLQDPVALSIDGLPDGVSGTFDPPLADGQFSTLTLIAGPNVVPTAIGEPLTLVVTGEAEGLARHANLLVHVAATDFVFSIDGTAPSLHPGGTATTRVYVERSGEIGDVALSVFDGLPPGVQAAFDPPLLRVSQGESQLVFTADGTITSGIHLLTLHASFTDEYGEILKVLGPVLLETHDAPPPPPPPPAIIPSTITAGASHTCGLTADGTAYCWGSNLNGQLGDGTTTDKAVATPVPQTGLRFAAITAGAQHTCAITAASASVGDGVVYCWGGNFVAQLGLGHRDDQLTPQRVTVSHRFLTIHTSAFHTCGIVSKDEFGADVQGVAYCWGPNAQGQLGDSTTTLRDRPVRVAAGLVLTTISAGGNHTCALTSTQVAYCWGQNAFGQIGDGTQSTQISPSPVTGSLMFTWISAGQSHTCGVTIGGAAYCWGNNGVARLGDGTTIMRIVPTEVSGGIAFRIVLAGSQGSCGISIAGGTYCWGSSVGDGTTTTRLVPTPVAGEHAFTTLAVGSLFHRCAQIASGQPYCWGDNLRGQIGTGSFPSSETSPDRNVLVPMPVVGWP